MPDWPTPPDSASPWPDRIPEPSFERSPPALDLADGLYHSRHPSGRMRLLASVVDGRLDRWLQLADGEPSGCFKAEGPPWFGQRYYPEGLVEDFARDDDTSEPYPPEQSFLEWATAYRDGMVAPPRRMPAWLVKNMQAFEAMKAGDRPPAHADRVLSDGVPVDLEALLPQFGGLSWHSPHQCYERLLHYLKWEPELARDFTNFATVACASSLLDSGQTENYLYPVWDAPSDAGEAALTDVPMFTRVREAASGTGDSRFDHRHWVSVLAGCCPWTRVRTGRLPSPIVWTVPPDGIDGFRLTRVCAELLLRQEASRGQVLGEYLQRVDRERFFAAASLAGAFLQSPDPGDADLIADLCASLRGPKILVSVGEWVHRQATGQPPVPRDERVVHLLGRFLNDLGPLIREALDQFRRGEPYWQGSSSWPQQDRDHAGSQRECAGKFLERSGLDVGPERNRFLLRVETAAERLALGPWKSCGIQREMLRDLERFLKEHPDGGHEYRRWRSAASWALSDWSSDERLAEALARSMLSAL